MTAKHKILITGGNGQLSTDLAQVFESRDLVVLTREDLDISQPHQVQEALLHHKPEVVINTAAVTDVDGCEHNVEQAQLVNSQGPQNLVRAAQLTGARVVQISTDYVFDGALDRPYIESDETNPQSIYGQTKLAGEQAMRDTDLIVRTSWLCGLHGSNILKTIVRLAQTDKAMSFVNDQIGHPSFTNDVAVIVRQLVELEAHGVFHVTNQGSVSWYQFAKTILDLMGRPSEQLAEITSDQLEPSRPAPRPANSVLDNKALPTVGLSPPPDFRETLPKLLEVLCE
ncbi:MAG TPA: dTDP-4-dehydrorhamnose reductase [Acidimicrobiaceae bacterium]|nr:dTDP-4-dehydrorhamnose reductase [Acidimicrobiaceae bacterium]